MQKESYKKVLVAGSIAYDEIMDFPSLFVKHLQADKLHQINVSFVVDRLEKQLGGTGTNIAYNLSLLLKQNVVLMASVGKDGKEFLEFFKKNHIDTSAVLFVENLYTATGKVITDLNNNQIWGFYYGACEMAKDIPVFGSKSDGKDFMIISANHSKAFLHFQEEAIKYKIDYMYDPGMALSWIQKEDIVEGINHCRYLIGNDYEISYILKWIEESVEELNKRGIAVITTLGEHGVRYQDSDHTLHVPAYKDGKIEDPTGAGDAWRAGFAAGLMQQKSIEESLKLGNILASFAIEKYGTVNHQPTLQDIDERIQKLESQKN